jgi:glucose dehydrogenase
MTRYLLNALLLAVLITLGWSAGFQPTVLMNRAPFFFFVGMVWLLVMLSTGNLLSPSQKQGGPGKADDHSST